MHGQRVGAEHVAAHAEPWGMSGGYEVVHEASRITTAGSHSSPPGDGLHDGSGVIVVRLLIQPRAGPNHLR